MGPVRSALVAAGLALVVGCSDGGAPDRLSEAWALVDVATGLLVQDCLLDAPGNLTAERVADVHPADRVDAELAARTDALLELQQQTIVPPFVTQACRFDLLDDLELAVEQAVGGHAATVHFRGELVAVTDPPMPGGGPLAWEVGLIDQGDGWRLDHVDVTNLDGSSVHG